MAPRLAPERSLATLSDSSILLDIKAVSIDASVEQQVHALVTAGKLPADREAEALEAVLRRESEGASTIGNGAAVPHARLSGIATPVVCIARLRRPLNLDAPDGRPVRFLFLILSPESESELHLELLLSIAQLMADQDFGATARLAADRDEFLDALRVFGEKVSVARESDLVTKDEMDVLRRTGHFAGGLLDDLKRRAPHYLSDFKDGLHPKALAATIFLFFACIAPTVAFGGLMTTLTGGQIGAMEMLIATSIGGIVYALTSGQPLTIVGGTGPLLVFTSVLYTVSVQVQLPFLPLFAWVGIWT
ncbi:MAG: PTS sugar transporter subunit IIA, partial [Myxococcota bacterium]